MADRFIVGLDIGTSKVSAIAARVPDEGPIEILGVGKAPSKGLRKGVVVDIPSTVESIRLAIDLAEENLSRPIERVYAGIAGSHITCLAGSTLVELTGIDGIITEKVLDEAVKAACPPAPEGKELIHAIATDCLVDGIDGVQNPVGLHATSLKVEVNAVFAATAAIRNIVECIERCGVEVADVVLEPLASGLAVLGPDERDVGVALIDIGAGTTDLALFKGGSMLHSHIFPVGGDHMTNDLSVALGISRRQSEAIKKLHAKAHRYLVEENEMVAIERLSDEVTTASRAYISEIIELRLVELFRLIARELAAQGLHSITPAGIVLTGGSSKLDSIQLLAQDVIRLPGRLGRPSGLTGMSEIIEDPVFATGIGLVLFGAEHEQPEMSDRKVVASEVKSYAGDIYGWLKERLAAAFTKLTEN